MKQMTTKHESKRDAFCMHHELDQSWATYGPGAISSPRNALTIWRGKNAVNFSAWEKEEKARRLSSNLSARQNIFTKQSAILNKSGLKYDFTQIYSKPFWDWWVNMVVPWQEKFGNVSLSRHHTVTRRIEGKVEVTVSLIDHYQINVIVYV